MRQDKLLMRWGPTTVIESLLAAWRTSNVDEIVVVMRQDQAELQTLCGDVTIVTPDIAPPEMKDSVLAAVEHIRKAYSPADGDAWLLAPADMPQLDPAVINQILAAHDPISPAIIVPTCDEKRGHPVLFPWAFASTVETLSEIQGVNTLLERFPVRELKCNVPAIHGDLDTPDDYNRLHPDADH